MDALVHSTAWFLVPVLLWNALLAGRLPAHYREPVFSRGVPGPLRWAEGILRVPVMAAPLAMRWSLDAVTQRYGLALYGLGLLAYCAAWLAVIRVPGGAWSRSAVGCTAPAWTPALWLTGMALLTGDTTVGGIRITAVYGLLIAVFVAVHTAHAALVWRRSVRGSAA